MFKSGRRQFCADVRSLPTIREVEAVRHPPELPTNCRNLPVRQLPVIGPRLIRSVYGRRSDHVPDFIEYAQAKNLKSLVTPTRIELVFSP